MEAMVILLFLAFMALIDSDSHDYSNLRRRHRQKGKGH